MKGRVRRHVRKALKVIGSVVGEVRVIRSVRVLVGAVVGTDRKSVV